MKSGTIRIVVHECDSIIHNGEQIDLYPTLHPCGKAPDPLKLCAEKDLRHSVQPITIHLLDKLRCSIRSFLTGSWDT